MRLTRREALCAGSAAAVAACAPLPRDVERALEDLAPAAGALPPFPPDVHATRQTDLRAALEAERCHAVLLGPTPSLRYFTGVSWNASERLFGCLFFLSGPPVWVAPEFEATRARESVGNAELATWEEHDDPHELVARIVRSRTPEGPGRLALDSHLRATHASRLFALLGAGEAADGLPITARVRARKTEPELARIRRACEITQRAIEVVRDRVLRPGVDEATVAAAQMEAQRRLGLRDTWCIALFGPNAAFPHGTRERRTLTEGEPALLDTGGDLEGYQSDVTRMLAIGPPAGRARAIHRVVWEAQQAALAAIRPGRLCEEIDAVARKVVADGGFGPGYRYFTHRLGHGIGLEGHEDPYFCPGNRTVLEPGMTLSDEPGIYIPGEVGVRLEDIVVVTDRGAERFGAAPPAVLGG